MDRSRIGIVIPAFNESDTILSVVSAVKKYGVPIVVDDGSIDNTGDLANEAGAILVSHEFNRGYDSALESGFRRACEIGCDVIITLDADGQHDPNLINKFIERINAGAEVVVGVRDSRQRLAEDLFAVYAKWRYGIYDPLCGLKAYKSNVYQALGHFDKYGSIGTELVIFAANNGFRIDQIRFNVRQRSGESRFGKIISGNYMIIRAMLYSLWQVK